ELDRRVNGGHDRNLDDQRERNVPPRVDELSCRRGGVLEASVSEEDEKRGFHEVGTLRQWNREDAAPGNVEDPNDDEEKKRQDLAPREEHRGARARLEPRQIDRR